MPRTRIGRLVTGPLRLLSYLSNLFGLGMILILVDNANG